MKSGKILNNQKAYDDFENSVKIHQDVKYHFSSRFDNKVKYKELGKYLVYKNGKKVNANGLIVDWRKPFKLKDGTIELLENYNPWWLE